MLPQYDLEQLILTIKRACSVPTSQLTYTDTDWAALSNDCLQTEVVPLIMSAREEYFVEYVDALAPADGMIMFPENAVGGKVRTVAYKQQDNPLILNNLPRLDLDAVAGVGFFNYNTFAGFYIQGNYIALYPNTSVPTNTNIRIYYYRRTLTLAPPEEYGRVLSVDENTNTVVLDYVPPDWAVDDELNSVESTPPFRTTNPTLTITGVSSPSLILDTVEDVTAGSYLSAKGYSAIPQIPVEGMNYLAQLTAAKALEGLGDRQGMQAALEKAQTLKKNFLIMISQRVDGSVKKLMPPDGGMRLWSGAGRRGRWWGW